MPLTLKTKDLLNSVQALKEFAALDVPVKLAFKLQRLLKRAQDAIDAALAVQKTILDKHTEKDENGKAVHPKDKDGNDITDQVKLKDPAAYQKDLDELFAEEVSFSMDRASPSEFGESLKVKPAVLLALHWLFVSE